MANKTKSTSSENPRRIIGTARAKPRRQPAKGKKAGRKRAGKSTKKKAAGKKKSDRRKKDTALVKNDKLNLETNVEVWAAYSRLRSRRLVAEELGVSEYLVREVLGSDPGRLKTMLDEFREKLIAGWEEKESRALAVIERLLHIAEAQVMEITAAAEEGRMTYIRNRDGERMPVLEATQFLVMSRLIDQMVALAHKAQQASVNYRAPQGERIGGDEDDPAAAGRIELMDDYAIARLLEGGGVELPPRLAKKVENLNQRKNPEQG